MFNEETIQCLECGNIIDLEDDGVLQSNDTVWCPICGRAQNANPDGFYLDGFSIDNYEEVDESWTMNYLSDDLNGRWDEDDYERACDEFEEYEKYLQGETETNPVKFSQIRREAIESDYGNANDRVSERLVTGRRKKPALSSAKEGKISNTTRVTSRRVGVTNEPVPDCLRKGPTKLELIEKRKADIRAREERRKANK